MDENGFYSSVASCKFHENFNGGHGNTLWRSLGKLTSYGTNKKMAKNFF